MLFLFWLLLAIVSFRIMMNHDYRKLTNPCKTTEIIDSGYIQYLLKKNLFYLALVCLVISSIGILYPIVNSNFIKNYPQAVAEAAANNDAITGARQLVESKLRAPATAKVLETKILDRKREDKEHITKYLVSLEIDAKNAFGAMLRSQFLVVLWLKDSDYRHFGYDPEHAVSEIDRSLLDAEITRIKLLNGW